MILKDEWKSKIYGGFLCKKFFFFLCKNLLMCKIFFLLVLCDYFDTDPKSLKDDIFTSVHETISNNLIFLEKESKIILKKK